VGPIRRKNPWAGVMCSFCAPTPIALSR
jgi:hypothetical protein